ncbi:hypothetical protein AGMMS50239_06290 [Bacteroidia bacterium]|nr:hypothetical protein AGMMS50239_06290 [Bacteroidia bacterium]
MKTIQFILFTVFLNLSVGQIQAQIKTQEEVQKPLRYKSLSSFKSNAQISDTLQYLEYNFSERQNQYQGKKVSDVINDIGFPVNYIVEYAVVSVLHNVDNTPDKLGSLSLGIKQFDTVPSPLSDYYVTIIFIDPPKIDDFLKVFDFKNRKITPDVYEFIKDMEVSAVTSNPYIPVKREKLKKEGKINELLKEKENE